MKKPRKGADGGSWMDTYGDMVTLLLCFFVLLYAISSVDQSKWQNFVASVNPEAREQVEAQQAQAAAEAAAESEAFQQMYESLNSEFEALGIDANVDVVQGVGYNFISFSDEVFFSGDSYELQENGRQVLDGFCRAIAPAASMISQIEVLGHTTELPGRYDMENDRRLSVNRAAEVTIYIEQQNLIDPARLVSMGFGQYRPIADMNTEEGQSQNRRVEILITDDQAVRQSLTDYYAEVYGPDVAAMQPDADQVTQEE